MKYFLESVGTKCLLNDPPLAEQESTESYHELEQIFKADIITLHVPLTTGGQYPTSQLINESFLDKLKPNVILINTSRGEVVDESALLSFKATNPDATFILDVWCDEPEISINLLRQCFIGTPHIAGYSYDGKLKATKILAKALFKYTKNVLNDGDVSSLESINHIIDCDDVAAVQLAVMQAYDVRSDAAALRELISMPTAEHGTYFDNLRKNYPIRREFTNRKINTKKLNEAMRQCLSELGFKTGLT